MEICCGYGCLGPFNDNESVNLLIISENNIFITTYVMIQYPYHLPYLYSVLLTLVLLNPDIIAFANSVDPDQLASEEANWSGSALFAIEYVII